MVSALKRKNPQQGRSRETRARLVAAARALAEERDWQDVSMSQIARAAKSSIGSLYARFENKQALFDHLDEAYAGDLKKLMAQLAAEGAEAGSLGDYIEGLARGFVTFHRRQRGLVRALVLTARMGRQPSFAARTEDMNASARPLIKGFLKFEHEVQAANKTEAASWALFIILTMIRERILFSESVQVIGSPDDARLVSEIVRAALGSLTLEHEGV